MEQPKISKPAHGEYSANHAGYIDQVKRDDLIAALESGLAGMVSFMKSLPAEKLDYRYQEGKWSVKEIFIHLLDVERIFMYRALRFSRNDSTPLPGFDDEQYIAEANAAWRPLPGLIAEYEAQRRSTIEFFKNISPVMARRTGIANGKETSVRALGYIVAGHEIHHMDVIRQRYL